MRVLSIVQKAELDFTRWPARRRVECQTPCSMISDANDFRPLHNHCPFLSSSSSTPTSLSTPSLFPTTYFHPSTPHPLTLPSVLDLRRHPQNRYDKRASLPLALPRHNRQRLHPGEIPQGSGQRQGLQTRGLGFQLQEVARGQCHEAYGCACGASI